VPPRFISQPVRVARAYEELAASIRQRIMSGELSAGDRLPAEAVLAREAEVSRSTVREALRTLEQAGLVERASPKIMVVKAPGAEPVTHDLHRFLDGRKVTFEHLYETLTVLEPELARLAAERSREDQFAPLEQNLAAQGAALDDFAQWARLDQDFHLAIAEMSDNPALVVARATTTELLAPLLERFVTSGSVTRRALAFHGRIVEAIRAGDGAEAAVATRQHLSEFRTAWDMTHLGDSPIELWASFEL
jgi:GntR family transcriptional repressor for pyruvate dehydrogenase complex